MFYYYYYLLYFYLEAPSLPNIAIDVQATSMTVNWTAPADNGGSPITAYRVVLLQQDTEIDEKNVTDPVTKTCVFAGLRKGTIYSLKVSARNFVFEGPFSQTTVQTKPQGKRVVNQIQPVNRSFSLT